MNQLTKLGPFAALVKLWNELSNPQRVVVVAFTAVAIVGVVTVGMLASKPKMSVLFSGLSADDAGAIVQKLSESKVQYQLSGDGSTIEVPSDKVYDLRLSMATQGLPQGGSVGFELFDKSSFGMTEFGEKVSYQRALQGELTRTIDTLAPVESARVLISIPEDKIYESEQEPAKASVALKLRRGMPLSDDQVAGIVHLVSSAVQGLQPSNVSVVDSEGNVLSDGSTGAAGTDGLLTSNQNKLKRQYESGLSQNLQSMLAKVVGPDKAVVRVSADLSFDQKQSKSETYQPDSKTPDGSRGVLLSENKTNESYNGGVIPPGAIGRTNKSTTSASGSNDNYTRTESNSQYEVAKKEEQVISAPGQVTRLSVAVLVDSNVDASKLAAIRQAVTAAAGINQTRGDQITVQSVAFDTSAQKQMDAEMAAASKSDLIKEIAKNGGAVILLIVFLIFLKKIMKQIKVQVPESEIPVDKEQLSQPASNPAEMLQKAGAQAYAHAEATAPTTEPEAAPNFSTQPQPNPIPPEVAKASPEDLARLVRNWMTEQ